jgi:UDPglucose 6-dehydrogenase
MFLGVRDSNDLHRGWIYDTLMRLLGSLRGQAIAVLGLTYKPGTDSLRRSAAVELSRRLVAAGASVLAYDPAVKKLPAELAGTIELVNAPDEALRAVSAAVIMTEWPEFRSIPSEAFSGDRKDSLVVVDPSGFLAGLLQGLPRLRYVAVGTPL